MIDSGNSYYNYGNFEIKIQNHKCNYYTVLLHEYIHYLQDTCTYFGAKLREDLYSRTQNVDTFLIQGCDITCLECLDSLFKTSLPNPSVFCSGKIEVLRIGTIIIGAKAIKENMAYLAQKYLDESFFKLYAGYELVSLYIETECQFLQNNYLAQFALDDICLMTENPAKALIKIVEYFKGKEQTVSILCNEKNIHKLYEICESLLLQESLLKYDESINCKIGINDYLCKTTLGSRKNIQDIISCLEFFSEHNYKLRLKKHSIITEKLIEYKKLSTKNFKINNNEECYRFQSVFFHSFGYPIINCDDNCEKFFNADTLTQLNYLS